MFYLFDKDEELIQIIKEDKVVEAYRTESINSPAALNTTSLEKPDDRAWFIAHKSESNLIEFYKIQQLKVQSKKWQIIATEYAFDELTSDGIVKDLRPNNEYVFSIVSRILEGSRWQIGLKKTGKKLTGNFYYLTRIEALKKLAENTSIEYKFRVVFDGNKITGRYIDVFDSIGEDRGKRFYHGSNLLNVEKAESRDNIFTALIGRGKGEELENGGFGRKITFEDIVWQKSKGDPTDKPNGQNYVEIPEMTKKFGLSNGKPRVSIVEFNEIEDKRELLNATYQKLIDISRPIVSYSAQVLDVGDTELGDIVSVIRKDLDIAYKTRIYERQINLLNPKNVTIKLGDEIKSHQKQQLDKISKSVEAQENNMNQVAERINENVDKKIIRENEKTKEQLFEEIKKRSSDLIKDGIGGYVRIYPDRILILADSNDEKTARKVWQWNKNGLGFSSTGVNGYYTMAWTYEGQFNTDFILADGITANKITSGTIDASKINVVNLRAESINSGVLQGDNSYYDLRNGTIKTTQSGRSNVMRHGQYFIMRGSDEILNISNYVGDGRDAYIIEGSGADSLRLGKSNRQGDYSRDYLTFNDRQNRAVLHTDFYRIVNGYNVPVPYNLAGQTTVDNIPAGGSSYVDITYGFNFSSLPVVVVSVNNGSPELFPVGTSAISRSGFRVHVKNNWNRSNSVTVNWIAMEMR